MPDPDRLQIVALSGSLRAASFNSGLLRAAIEVAPEGVHVELKTIRGIPIYDGDDEARSGVPDVVEALKASVASSDGLLIASPEYNNSVPGPLKNAIDWMSRPPKDIARVFSGRPIGLIGASPGRGGTRFGQTAWLPVFRTLGARLYAENSLYVAEAAKSFDADSTLIDPKIRELLATFMKGFAAFVRTQRA